MGNKRKRPYLERACKKKRQDSQAAESATNELHLDPKLWSKLPSAVANRVLSYVPLHRLIDTLLRVDWRWAKLLRSTAFIQNFGRGNNLNSSYGIVMLEDPKVPRLMGFEEESQWWLSFPRKLHVEIEMKKGTVIFGHGSRDGLMLCENTRCKWSGQRLMSMLCSRTQSDIVCHTEVGVWNPLLCSFKWLPKNPYLISMYDPYNCRTHYAVMVHEPCRTYRVFLSVFDGSHKFYSVYDSTTGCWSSRKRLPDFYNGELETWRRVASCDRYIFLRGFQNRRLGYEDIGKFYIYWYDAEKDMWDLVFVSEILRDLGLWADNLKNPPIVENFVILNGILYMLIRMVHSNEERRGIGSEVCFLASMDLSALGDVDFGAASSTRFKFEAFVPDGFLVQEGRERISLASRANFNLYCYTMKGKGYIGVQTTKSGHFLYYDVSEGVWSKHEQSLEVGGNKWETGQLYFHFKPSFVVP